MVAVLPTHRRRGILTRMMARQMEDCHELREPLALLVSTEGLIYGRFGYGIGSQHEDWSIPTEYGQFAFDHEPPGSLRFIDKAEARRVLPNLYKNEFLRRPGMVAYPASIWDIFIMESETGPRSIVEDVWVLYEESGQPLGYAKYKVKDGTLMVQELMATTRMAGASLWRLCLDHDLVSHVEAVRRPLDDPLPWILSEPRRLQRVVSDRMWLRLVDVQMALSGRSYMSNGRILLDVRDPFCHWNEGVYELEVGNEGTQCSRSDGKADMVLGAADLAAVYLGTVRFRTLLRAGRVDALRPGALLVADAMFDTQFQPWSPYDL